MKKKLLSLALALVMCLGLCIPAYAEDVDFTYDELRDMVRFAWNDDPDLGPVHYWVQKPLFVTSIRNEQGPLIDWAGYNPFDKDDTWTCENISKEDCTLHIKLEPWVKDLKQKDAYTWCGKTYDLRTTGQFVDYDLENNDENGYQLKLKPGESVEISLADFIDNEVLGTDNGDLTYIYRIDIHFRFDKDSSKKCKPCLVAALMIDPSSAELCRQRAAAAQALTDVEGTSFADAVDWAARRGIANGKTSTTFAPGDTCTVSHILTFLWRAEGCPNEGENERAAVAAWANSLDIDTSDITAPCTRAMAVTYMWKAAGSPEASEPATFSDVPADADYADAVAWAVENHITAGTGDGTTFSPDNTCTRGQIVTFLYRASK